MKKISRRQFLTATALGAASLLSACGASSSSATAGSTGSTSGAGQKQVVKVGLSTPLSGPAPRMGEIIKETAEMSVAMVTEKGMIHDYELELVVMDDKITSEGAVDAINNLVFQEKAKVIIGHLMSVQNLATGPICEDEKIPLICYGGGAVPTMQGWHYTMRSTVDDFATIHAMVDYMAGELGYKKLLSFTLTPMPAPLASRKAALI